MIISLSDACNVFSMMQDRVTEAAARLRKARSTVAASREATANGAAPIDSHRAAQYLAHCETEADVALTEYRDAAPQFAYVTSLFTAANDDSIAAPVPDDKATVLCKLLAHGSLGFGEVYEITRWTREECQAAIEQAIADGRVQKVTDPSQQPVFRLKAFFRPAK